MQDAVEHGGSEYRIASERLVQLPNAGFEVRIVDPFSKHSATIRENGFACSRPNGR